MCGRFTLRTPNRILLETFALESGPDFPIRFNIAPTQAVLAIRWSEPKRELVAMRWGLVPSWAKDVSIGNRMINARSETVAEKPAFRAAWKRRRALILADGFYEWHPVEKGKKQPYFIHRRDEQPFAFAGLWEHWPSVDPPLESCTILTTSASDLLRPIHDRSPVVLSPEDYDRWLDPEYTDLSSLKEILKPSVDEETFVMQPVSTRVNNPRYDRPDCAEG